VLSLALDVTDANQIAAVVRAAHDKFGRIDVLVNNAGYGYQGSVEESEEAQIHVQFETNTFGVFAITRAVLPVMRAQRSGVISELAERPDPPRHLMLGGQIPGAALLPLARLGEIKQELV